MYTRIRSRGMSLKTVRFEARPNPCGIFSVGKGSIGGLKAHKGNFVGLLVGEKFQLALFYQTQSAFRADE